MCWCARLVGALLLVSAWGLHLSLRDQPPSICGFAHYGNRIGSAQRLVETQLAAGVADWNIVVPMPPPCAEAQVTGVDMRVCDADEPPDVSMHDALSARVHRPGGLAAPATVNVTVYCILPAPATPATLTHHTESTFETVSNDVRPKQNTFNKESKSQQKSESYETESIDLTSVEQLTTASTPMPLPAWVKHTPPTEVVTLSPKKTTDSKEKLPHSVKVTINISPPHQKSIEEDVSQSYDYEIPLLSSKLKSGEEVSSPPYIMTRGSGVPARPRPPARAAQHTGLAGAKYAGMPPAQYPEMSTAQDAGMPDAQCAVSAGTQYAGLSGAQHTGAPCSQHAGAPCSQHAGAPCAQYAGASCAQHAGAPCAQHAEMTSAYDLMSPPYSILPGAYSVTPFYRPTRFLDPRLRFVQRRRPLLFFRRFLPNVS